MKSIFNWVVVLFFISSCANKVAPTGGAKDVTPPQLINVFPENNSLNFNANQITLNFDEYVQLNDAANQILISPLLEKQPVFKTSKKSVVITFQNQLANNTTYSINFGKAIADVHEGNVNDTIRYVFSTGNKIDSLVIQGKVKDAETLKPCVKYCILLYEITDRSNLEELLKVKPSYFGRTDESGFFNIRNLKKGSYYLVAVDDKNNNYLADSDESVGFFSGVLDLPINSNIDIYSFKQAPKEVRLVKSGLLDRTTALIVYNLPNQLTCQVIGNTRSNKDFYYLPNVAGDSLFIHLKDTSISEVQFLISDGKAINDTLSFDFSEKKLNALNFEWKNIQTMTDTLRLISNHPLQKLNSPALLFKDTVLIDSIYLLEEAANKWRLNNYSFSRGVRYQLVLPKGIIQDIYANKNDSLQMYISLPDREHSGNIIAHLEYQINNNPYLVQLLNNEYKVVCQQRLLKGQSIKDFHFDYVNPGKYFIRVVDDEDNNQQLSQGKLTKKQPEKVWITDLFTVRANWDLDIQLKLIKENDRQLIEPN
ncbi:MAG: Ig-like domain-containing protein [Bacteroidota bacterium]